jgi:hypothetical protein
MKEGVDNDDHFYTICLVFLLILFAQEKYHERQWRKSDPEGYKRYKKEMAYYSQPPAYS